jgi:hypothetical protein
VPQVSYETWEFTNPNPPPGWISGVNPFRLSLIFVFAVDPVLPILSLLLLAALFTFFALLATIAHNPHSSTQFMRRRPGS